MSSLNYASPEAFLRHLCAGLRGARKAVGSIPSASGGAEFRSPELSSGLRSRPTRPPYMSIKCSDSHDMNRKEYGFRLCFLAAGQHAKVLPGLYFLRRQPARWRALGTPSRHYASKQ